jgi:hypothetical protein
MEKSKAMMARAPLKILGNKVLAQTVDWQANFQVDVEIAASNGASSTT